MIKTNKDMSNNEFYTFAEHIQPLIKYLKDKNIKIIWCPADTSESNFVKEFKASGFEVKHTHIKNGEDFLTYEPDFEFDAIITNPPYNIKREWIQKCLDHDQPWILLLPNTVIMNKIVKMNSSKINFLFFSKRIPFFEPNGDKVSPADTLYLAYDILDSNDVIDIEERNKNE